MIRRLGLLYRAFGLLIALRVSSVKGFSFAFGVRTATNDLQTKISPAQIPEDLDDIREFRKATRKVEGIQRDATLKYFNADSIAQKKVLCLVAREKSRPYRVLGTADIRIEQKSGNALVTNVLVREECRGKGLATQLMVATEDLARSNGYAKQLILSVSSQNVPAVKLYRRCGFDTPGMHSLMSTISETTGMDILLNMEKKL